MIQFKAMYPLYVCRDLELQRTFYTENFGFQVAFFEPDFYLHLVNINNGVQVGFMLPNLATQPQFLHTKAATDGMVLSFEVADAKDAYAEAQKQGLDIHFGLKEEPWQQTHFMVRDPAGLILDIVEDRN
ncbi:MAG: VOC family protein [Leptolyngbyaceae cyanobacterium MO_188.B28]|nr:VOC family protein [Leptolyngbyaceae cyanobacterium MO_188.B28]